MPYRIKIVKFSFADMQHVAGEAYALLRLSEGSIVAGLEPCHDKKLGPVMVGVVFEYWQPPGIDIGTKSKRSS